jgi:ABC-type ATPase with predicted acetyltransferase domain
MQLTVRHQFLPKTNSTRASLVMDHFGIDFEQGSHLIAEDFELPLEQGDLVLFTGESGSGKSSLMKAAAQKLREQGDSVIDLDELTWENGVLVDLLPVEFSDALRLLTGCGLGEAQLLLRTPAELSDGQRFRFRLALALAQRPQWILVDEFTATLDRRLARLVAFNLRRMAAHGRTGLLLATTHADLEEDLSPDLSVRCGLDGGISVTTRDSVGLKKKCHPWPGICGSLPRPSPTGRTSLGGIIAATTSD